MLTGAKTISENFIKFGLKTAEIWLIAWSGGGKTYYFLSTLRSTEVIMVNVQQLNVEKERIDELVKLVERLTQRVAELEANMSPKQKNSEC